jgi:rubrerythrin
MITINSLTDFHVIDLTKLTDAQLVECNAALDKFFEGKKIDPLIEGDAYDSVVSEQYKRELVEAKKKYPHACTSCNGSGLITTHGDYDNPPDTDICGFCLEEGRCPVCGEDVTLVESKYEDHFECKHCGYDDRKAEEVLPSCPF